MNPKELITKAGREARRNRKVEARREANEERRDEIIKPEIDNIYNDIDQNANDFHAARISEIDAELTDFKGTDAEKQLLENEKLMLQAHPDQDAKNEWFTAKIVEVGREEYAKQLAARMDNTFNVKQGKRNQVEEAHDNYMIAVGVRLRHEAETAGINPADDLGLRKAKLKFLLGDPATPVDPADPASSLGERGALEKELLKARKLNSGRYVEKVDEHGNKTTERKSENMSLTEFVGSKWRQWSKEGLKGRIKKIALGIGAGALLGLAAGATAGASAAVVLSVLGASKVLKAAGTARVNKAAATGAAEEDAAAAFERIEQLRSVINLDDPTNENYMDYDKLDSTMWDNKDRAHDLNATHKRTMAVMGGLALVGGATAGGALEHFVTHGPYGGIGEGGRHIFGSGNAHAEAANNNAGAGGHGPNTSDTHGHNTSTGNKGGSTSPDVKSGNGGSTNADTGNGRLPLDNHNGSGADNGSGAGETTGSTPPSAEHVIHSSDMNGKWVEQVYREAGLSPEHYIDHAAAAMKDGMLQQVDQGNGTFYYELTLKGMHHLGLTDPSTYDRTTTEHIMTILAEYSNGEIQVAA